MGWTDARVELLKKLWQDGLSASQIARQLGGVTRNAVIGKVHRLGLSGRAAPSKPRRAAFKAPRPVRPLRRRASPAAVIPSPKRPLLHIVPEGPGSATALTLGAHMCRWPIGDPRQESFTFCGRGAAGDGPYCGDHAAVAYQPSAGKKGAKDLERALRRYIC
jgi:GcrA cell cycle regulator